MKPTYSVDTSRGFIALISTFILATILSTLVIAANQDTFSARSILTDEESYRQAVYNAQSCAIMAFHSLSIDQNRFENSKPITIQLGEHSDCTIVSATTSPTGAIVETNGHALNSVVSYITTGMRVGTSSSAYFVPVSSQRKRTLSNP